MFVVGVIIVSFLVLSSAFVVMFAKYSKTGKIGDKQFSITKAYLDGEKTLLYMDTLAEQAYLQAAQAFANNAGMYDPGVCSVKGVSIINGDCGFNDDLLKENFKKYLNQAFNQHIKNYEEAYIPFNIYNFYEKDDMTYGIAKKPILVLIGTSGEQTNCFPGLLQYFPVSGSYVTDNTWGSEDDPDAIKINVKNQNTAVVAVVDGEVKDKGTMDGEQFIEIVSGENTFQYSHLEISNAMIRGGSVKAGEPIASSSDYIKFRTYRNNIPMNPACALQRLRQSNQIQGYYYVYPHISFEPKYNFIDDFNKVMETAEDIIDVCGDDINCVKNNYDNKKINDDLTLHVGDCEGNEIIENSVVGFCVESQDEEKGFYAHQQTTTITTNPRTGIDKETTTTTLKFMPLQIRFALDTSKDFDAPEISLPEPPLPDFAAVSAEDSAFGINDICRFWPNKETDEDAAKLAHEAGVKWSRVAPNWLKIEPEKGKYDFSILDHQLKTLTQQKIISYIMLVHSGTCPAWISSSPDSDDLKGYPPKNDGDWKSWRDFVANLVRRYGCGQGGKCWVTHWEIWSEPEGIYWREKGGSAQEYVSFLRAAHDTIKAIDPNAKIILGRFKDYPVVMLNTEDFSKQPDEETEFIKDVFENGAGEYIDVFSIGGPYVCDWNNEKTLAKALSDRYQKANALLSHYNSGEIPVWITETGCTSDINDDGISDPEGEAKQAEDLKDVYEQAMKIGYSKIFWRHFEEVPESEEYRSGLYGIVRRDTLEPKPAYWAYKETATPQASSQKTPGKADIIPPQETPQTSGLVWPTKGTISQCYGEETPGTDELHGGIDIGAAQGTKVVAAAKARVIDIRIHSKNYNPPCESDQSIAYAGGTQIILYHPDLGIYTKYGHLYKIENEILQKFNQGEDVEVEQGQTIAYVGNTGCSTGSHLDFRISKSNNFAWNIVEDPANYLSGGCRYLREV